MVQVGVFLGAAGKYVVGGRIDTQRHADKLVVYLAVGDGIWQVGQRRAFGDGRQTLRELANLADIVVFFNVPAGTGDCNTVQYLKKVEVQHPQQFVGGTQLDVPFAPCVECFLCSTENLFYRPVGGYLVDPSVAVALIGQSQLIPQVIETIVDRRGRQHQYTGTGTGADDLVHQVGVAVCLAGVVNVAAVAEVVGFIDDHQIVGTPVDLGEIQFTGESPCPGQIGVVQHIIAQPVTGDGVVDIVGLIGHPVITELLGTQHQHTEIAVFIVFDDGQCREGLAQANTVRKNTAVILFQLADDG